MSVLDISLGAASFRGDRLANANAQDIRVDAGVGNVELDLGGQWTQDIDLHVEVTLGIVTIHVPSAVGVHVSLEKTVASFDHEGLIERDGAWVSKQLGLGATQAPRDRRDGFRQAHDRQNGALAYRRFAHHLRL